MVAGSSLEPVRVFYLGQLGGSLEKTKSVMMESWKTLRFFLTIKYTCQAIPQNYLCLCLTLCFHQVWSTRFPSSAFHTDDMVEKSPVCIILHEGKYHQSHNADSWNCWMERYMHFDYERYCHIALHRGCNHGVAEAGHPCNVIPTFSSLALSHM